MIIYPAIDLKEGQAVRLRQGVAGDKTVYGRPMDMAHDFLAQGATWIHVVDLDGAFTGQGSNLAVISDIAKIARVQTGGGIRTMQDIADRLEAGAQRVILGTVAVEQPELVAAACARYPGRIAVGIDAKEGRVATRGWVKDAGITPLELALQVKTMGVSTLIYTDISRDGMLEGPNAAATRALIEASGMEVIASGGMGRLEDIARVADTGAAGVIIGKAIYEKRFTLAQALAAAKEG
nr:1-(5-phosphoribosyl)-5-[(5-phosphoribosylamino)methylideneamino]imidazole-4-carboxamide isomerase [bacterium]